MADEDLIWDEKQSSNLFEHKLFNLREVNFVRKDGQEGKFIRLHSPDWVNVVAEDEEENILLVRQFRFGSSSICLEFPGGVVDQGESPLQAAQRELLEETGYLAQEWKLLGSANPNASFMTNTQWAFYARGLRKHAELHLDATEFLEPTWVTLDELKQDKHTEFFKNACMIFPWFLYLQTHKTKDRDLT